MVQTISSRKILAGKKRILIEKPRSLCRVFFSIDRIANSPAWYTTKISFDDPLFLSFFAFNGWLNHFQAEGEDIFQGNIWAFNDSDADFWYVCTEILH